jgi:hypothetical protein
LPAIEATDRGPRNVLALLDSVDGAYERAQLGLRQEVTGQTVTLDEL